MPTPPVTPPATPPTAPPAPASVPVPPRVPLVTETVEVKDLNHDQALEIIKSLPVDDTVPDVTFPIDPVKAFQKNALAGSTGMKSTGLVVSKYTKTVGNYAFWMNLLTIVLIAAFWGIILYGVGKKLGFLHQENVYIPLVLIGTVSVFLLIIDKCWVTAEALEVYLFEDLDGKIIPFNQGFKFKPWWWKSYSKKPKETLASDREWPDEDQTRSKDDLLFKLQWSVFSKILTDHLHSVLMFSDETAKSQITSEYRNRFRAILRQNSAETIMTHIEQIAAWVNKIVGDEDEVTLFERKFGRSITATITNLDLDDTSKKSYEALVNGRILGKIIRDIQKSCPAGTSADEILRMAMRTMNAEGFSTETVSIMGQGANNIRSLVLRGDDDHHVT